MASPIERRLAALEARLIEPERRTFWILLVSPGQLNRVTRIQHSDQVWHRRDGESEEALKIRAISEAVLRPGHSALVMLVD